MKKLAGVVLSVLIYLAVFDVVGVIVSMVFDIAPIRGKSSLLFYSIWFVLGVFCGLLCYNQTCGRLAKSGDKDWTATPEATGLGRFVLLTIAAVVALISLASYAIMWRKGGDGDFFVPDNMALSLTFFVAVVGSAILGQTVFLPSAKS